MHATKAEKQEAKCYSTYVLLTQELKLGHANCIITILDYIKKQCCPYGIYSPSTPRLFPKPLHEKQ